MNLNLQIGKKTTSNNLQHECVNNLYPILKYFDVRYIDYGNRISMPCPIHHGTKYSCSIYKNTGLYRCFSRKCHEKTGQDLIGFISGIINSTRDEAEKLFLTKIGNVSKHSPELSEKRQFIDFSNSISHIWFREQPTYPLNIVDNQTSPPNYLIQRGFCPETLARYKAFTATRGIFENRVVIPVKSPYIDRWAGFTARYPSDNYRPNAKWLHCKRLLTQYNIFNFNEAKDVINEDGVIIVCEGPLDVINLVSKGVNCCVAIFGSHMSDVQQYIIESANPRTVLVGTDNDEPGNKASNGIFKRFNKLCKVVRLKFNKKDLGELTREEVDNCILKQVEKYKNKI